MKAQLKVDLIRTQAMIENIYRTIGIIKNSTIGIYPDPFIQDLKYIEQELEEAYQILEIEKQDAMRKADKDKESK